MKHTDIIILIILSYFKGPKACKIIQGGTSTDLSSVYFMQGAYVNIFGIENIRLTRCGYTGEDGFELSVPSDKGNGGSLAP
jgi:aminomethyltransferase